MPELRPSARDFADPIAYMASEEVSALGAQFGLLKIIPPADFKPPMSINESKFRFVPRVQTLKELNLLNRCRMFFFKQLVNCNKMHKLSAPVAGFALVRGVKVHYYDVFIECVKFYGGELTKLSSNLMANDWGLWELLETKLKVHNYLLRDVYGQQLMHYFDFLSQRPEFTTMLIAEQHPTSILQDGVKESEDDEDGDDDEDEDEDEACLICHKDNNPENTLLCDSCNKAFHMACLQPPITKIPADSWCCNNCIVGNGYYGFKDALEEYTLLEFKELSAKFDEKHFPNGKPQGIETLEHEFWELVNNTDNNVEIHYGADIHNQRMGQVSGFPTKEWIPSTHRVGSSRQEYNAYVRHPMNLNNLPFDKRSLLHYLDVDISGMTVPWIYVGNTFSTFCWHVEDQYTLSANYQHSGATKRWYGIPSRHADKFEDYMKSLAPDLFAKQPDILHQLITLVSPDKLESAGIECYAASQEAGEYIVTYPRVYHAGFNCGFNLNEAVNFTMTSWLDYGVLASRNYRKQGEKNSVFDIYELMMTILEAFAAGENVEEELVTKCLESLKPRVQDEYTIQQTVTQSLEIKPQRYELGKQSYDMTQQELKEREDGITCCRCKGFCTFAFVRAYKPLSTPTESHLPTPNGSPEDDHRRSKRIKVIHDAEKFDIDVYCLEDYLKLEGNHLDEFFVMHDVSEAKKLIQKVDRMLILL